MREELSFALDLVQQCMPVALEYQAGGSRMLDLRHKPGNEGPITEADHEINRRLVRALEQRFPDDVVLAEESAHENAHSGGWRRAHRCWHVDPIDGTREFARGRTGWTIQMGLCVDGQPVLGVVAEPATERLTWGLVDDGACIAMQRIGHDPAQPLPPLPRQRDMAELVLIGGKALPLSRQHAIRRALRVDGTRTLSAGSVGVRMVAVARGDADAYAQAPGRTKTWDTCAPEAILRALGARVTDLRGRPLSYRGPSPAHPAGVLATSSTLHGPLIERLAPLAARWLSDRSG